MESASTARDTQESPARNAYAITPHDTNEVGVTQPRAIYVGVSGDITAVLQGDPDANSVLFKAVPVGIFPIKVRIVLATGTTATNMIALY